jgi:hypothetical protein
MHLNYCGCIKSTILIVKIRYAQANMIYVKKQNHNKRFSLPPREKNGNI